MGVMDKEVNYFGLIDNVNNKDIDYTHIFDKVYGLEREKELIIKVLKWFNNKDYYDSLIVSIPRGILLYGGPGNGKTYIIKQIINNTNCPCIIYKGNSNNNTEYLYKVFDEIKKYNKCILVIDELDLLLDESRENYRALQEGLDGLLTTSNVLVLSATNSISDIPYPLRRKGRFDYHIHIAKPDCDSALKYMLDMFNNLNVVLDKSINLDSIKIMLDNFNFSEIKSIVNNVVLENGVENINKEMIIEELYKINEGVNSINEGSINFQISLHEAAHCYMAHYYKNDYLISRVYVSKYGGSTIIKNKNDLIESYNQKIENIECSLAGIIAEKVYYKNNGSTGSWEDLKEAMSEAKNLFDSFGYLKSGYTDTNVNMENKCEYRLATTEKNASKLINKLEKKIYRIIRKNIKVIEYLALILQKRIIIDGIEVYKILDDLIENKDMNKVVKKYI